jgi:hypothetical protein
MKTLNFKTICQGLLVLFTLFCFSFNSNAAGTHFESLNGKSNLSKEIGNKSLALSFNSLEEMNSFDFKKLDQLDNLYFVDCTVSVSVSAYGFAVTFSVTAPTCSQAGAGAASAVSSFIRQMREQK